MRGQFLLCIKLAPALLVFLVRTFLADFEHLEARLKIAACHGGYSCILQNFNLSAGLISLPVILAGFLIFVQRAIGNADMMKKACPPPARINPVKSFEIEFECLFKMSCTMKSGRIIE